LLSPAEPLSVFDGPGSDDDPDEGSWREYEAVDDRFAEPDEPDLGPDIPQPPDPSTNVVDPFLYRRFWALVVVFNAALLVLGLAVMFALFEGDYSLAARLLVVGAGVLGFGLYRYRATKRRLAERSTETSPDGGTEDEREPDPRDGTGGPEERNG
jgi:hypothetical protein